jgi:hypothetical protein
MKKFTLLAIAIMFIGCSILGTADRQTMMSKWQKSDRDVELLADINGWSNWQAKGNPLEPGKCADQAEVKLSVLKELNIPAKRMHCTIEGQGHAFVIATLDRDYIMDNGTINDCVWESGQAIKAANGIKGVEEW